MTLGDDNTFARARRRRHRADDRRHRRLPQLGRSGGSAGWPCCSTLGTALLMRWGLTPLRRVRQDLEQDPRRRDPAPRRRLSERDRAAGARPQRADRFQPRDRRARAHACRQSRACAEDAARRAAERDGAAATSALAAKVGEQIGHHARPGRASPEPRPHRGAGERHRRGDAGRAGASPALAARDAQGAPGAPARHRTRRSRRSCASAARSRIWRR